ncbi:MAG: HAMP domain-containing histidine kinase [Chloroflexi bacterium]|nr:HAMP domain-containing histidine kinase [Chloroflexota bacterium]MBT4141979.1 HAMP domain-containing histidine kinase [Chloroflexota bacterium]MBT4340507.1 HAMP domain-containing histidine kinase [Chloroflexota bacterium]MBT5476596.1 HAMP domain-containing histidine kinase [Chloroflexota bacterium]MBT5893404.1 HAMP domain-containing histidine kinase [Chloroflexota bacterium]
MENVFDCAVKSDIERSVGKQGSGIGLFVANAIFEAHGGKIVIESMPDIETKVWIEIPNAVESIISG